jgi:hypothetical protein
VITTGALDVKLEKAQQGDEIVAWVPEIWTYGLWSPSQEEAL